MIFKPLVDEIPCFGAVSFSLREKVNQLLLQLIGFIIVGKSINLFKCLCQLVTLQKKMNFTLKVVGGDISAIPGLASAIEVEEFPFSNYFLRFGQFCIIV